MDRQQTIDAAVALAVDIADDNRHGYSQANRWGPDVLDIPGYNGYTVSRGGTVYSKSGKPMRKHETKKGYYRVRVYVNGGKKWLHIHQAVARAFIQNPENLPCINHKDENKKNNAVENLEWCTQAYNLGYGTKPQKTAAANQRTKGHKVVLSKDGVIKYYPSINAASKAEKISRPAITKACKSGNSEWRYAS